MSLTPEESREQAFDLFGIDDEFDRIALTELSRDLTREIPQPGSEAEQTLIQIGRIVGKRFGL